MAFSFDTVCFPTEQTYRVIGPEHSSRVQGAHRASLVASLTGQLAEYGVVVEDVEHGDGEGCFAMVFTARMVNPLLTLPALREFLKKKGAEMGISLRVQREDLFLAMHRI